MQKLLVCDYDGTYAEDNNSSSISENKDSSSIFINNGNLFAFATGRNFNSIKEQTTLYGLPYNYLICNNGTSIFDNNDSLIHYNLIPFASVIKTIKYLNRKKIILSIKYHDIYGNETSNFTEVAEVVCTVNIGTPEILEEVRNEISFLQSLYFTTNNSQIHTLGNDKTEYLVIKEPSDKKEAIAFISQVNRISHSRIYTIGNDFNDYGMLECYNGFKMKDSRSELELLDVPEVSSVHELIKRIEG